MTDATGTNSVPDSTVAADSRTPSKARRRLLMAAGAALLCAACQASTIAAYGTPPRFDAGNPTVDAGGQNDGATDAGDAKKL